MSSIPAAWLVVAADGNRAVFLDHATADRYAARVHGIVYPLVIAEAHAIDATHTEG